MTEYDPDEEIKLTFWEHEPKKTRKKEEKLPKKLRNGW